MRPPAHPNSFGDIHMVSKIARTWRDNSLTDCLTCAPAELIRSKGDQTMTVEQLTAEIIPRGRGAPCRPLSNPMLTTHREAPLSHENPRKTVAADSCDRHRHSLYPLSLGAHRDRAGRDQVRAAAAHSPLC